MMKTTDSRPGGRWMPATCFHQSITKIGCRRGTFLRGYMYEFIELFAPHLTRDLVDEAFSCHSKSELDGLFADLDRVAYPLRTLER